MRSILKVSSHFEICTQDEVNVQKPLLKILLSPWPYLAIRLGLAFLFLYAGTIKLMGLKAFAKAISNYGIVPDIFVPAIAVGLPIVEVLAAVALIFNLKTGLYSVSGLLLFFLAVLGYGVLAQLDIDCGCFGPEDIAQQKGLTHAFLRDSGLVCAAVFLNWSRRVRDRQGQ
jgi:uncharacterized membrane protein YphA (DoxX/SURF4 family)